MQNPQNDFYVASVAAVTKEQLDSFHLFRKTSGYLEGYLKERALYDESAHEARTYVVLDAATDEIVGYFSLKATSMMVYSRRSRKSLPMIEMANFAVSDSYKAAHPNVRSLGIGIFYDFVIPLVKEISLRVGIWGICIYALPQKHLTQFYADKLGFCELPRKWSRRLYHHAKPAYDRGCIFMYQKI